MCQGDAQALSMRQGQGGRGWCTAFTLHVQSRLLRCVMPGTHSVLMVLLCVGGIITSQTSQTRGMMHALG